MSKFINKAHACMVLIASIVVPIENGPEQITESLATNVMYSKFTLRTKIGFKHGEAKPTGPKFGGIYNLINSAAIRINNDETRFYATGADLYTDTFNRSGREDNNMDYIVVPDSYTQNIDYSFAGRRSVLGGVVVPDGAFALDLRHTSAGNQTYNALELVLNTGDISDVFKDPADTSIDSLIIEVWGEQLFHDEQSRQALAITDKRYAEMVCKHHVGKVNDVTLVNTFPLEALGRIKDGVYLSDLLITQLDEKGAAIPFDDENAIVTVQVAGQDFCSYPVWALREKQNNRRLQAVPPNVLMLTLVQEASSLGGLSPAELFAGATLNIKANTVDGADGEPCLHIMKTYTAKAV